MRLIILPLTYSEREKQVNAVDRTIDFAIRIPEDEKRSFVLAGICIAADTFIREDQSQRIGGLLKMTKVGRMLQEEFDQKERMLQEKYDQMEKKMQKMERQIQQQDQQIQQQIRELRFSREIIIRNLLLDGFTPEKVRLLTGAELNEIERIRQSSFSKTALKEMSAM